MKVKVYAALKEHFKPEFEVTESVRNTDELKNFLQAINAKSAEILNSCRFAVKDTFIDNEFKLQENDTVVIIPPSSGG
jgi:molybdopterin synthase sulfur carrier subunit